MKLKQARAIRACFAYNTLINVLQVSKLREIVFEGIATALITPFLQDSYIDYNALERIIEQQLSAGINALVVSGTTGESATLTDAEHYELIKFVVSASAGRVPVIAGAGSNDSEHGRRLCRSAMRAGADALLLVTPYYNKCNEVGMVEHYRRCSSGTGDSLPIIIYNVPSRTGINIKPAYYEKLLELENIVAVKEASGNLSQVADIMADYGNEIAVYAGNDELTVPMLSLGSKGVISVVSHVIPSQMVGICQDYFTGRTERSRNVMLHYMDLMKAMFADVNPLPVKYAMSHLGYCRSECRLPLGEMKESEKLKLKNIIEKYHII